MYSFVIFYTDPFYQRSTRAKENQEYLGDIGYTIHMYVNSYQTFRCKGNSNPLLQQPSTAYGVLLGAIKQVFGIYIAHG